jgi:phage-related protein (TIGR01555 family)
MTKKKGKPAAALSDFEKTVLNSNAMTNGLGAALGLEGGGAGFPYNQGNPYTEQLSQTTTIFKNLRYYLISNFRQILSEAYVELGLVQTIVDVPVDDALRGGIEIKSKQLSEEQIEELQVSMDRDDDLNVAGQAAKWNRLFGGAGIVIMTDQDPETPLDIEAITKDSNLEFKAVDMWELFWNMQNTDGYDPEIQDENFEYYNYYAKRVHKSRVMRLKGLAAPSFIRPRLRGWGFSVVETLVRSMNQYLKATDLSFEVLDEFKLDVFKMKNLLNTLLAPGGEAKIRQRVQLANAQKNYQNALVMDSEDDFDHKQLSFSGLAETMSGIRMQIAADMRIPIIKLFGQSVSTGGLGTSAQEEMENYNSMVESQVRNKIKYDVLRMLEIKCQKLFGFIPDDMSIAFKPLRTLSAEQEQNVKTQKFNRAMQLRSTGEITTFELRETVNKGELLDITLDNAGDELNPSDPDVVDLITGADEVDANAVAAGDKGANSEDDPSGPTKVKGADKPGNEEKKDSKPLNPGKSGPSPTKPTKPSKPTVLNIRNELVKRGMKNSLAYDVAAYVVDGGDGTMAPGRAPFFEKAKAQDPGLYDRAVAASQQAFGKVKIPFVKWWYEKEGGKFNGSGA